MRVPITNSRLIWIFFFLFEFSRSLQMNWVHITLIWALFWIVCLENCGVYKELLGVGIVIVLVIIDVDTVLLEGGVWISCNLKRVSFFLSWRVEIYHVASWIWLLIILKEVVILDRWSRSILLIYMRSVWAHNQKSYESVVELPKVNSLLLLDKWTRWLIWINW